MLPDSPVARAKIKMAEGQAELEPSSRSVRRLLSWRAARSVGTAAAALAKTRRELTNFILMQGLDIPGRL
jgi:hypothetical protein